jgi:hypothetical protein
MPLLTRQEQVDVVIGMTCDCCGKTDHHHVNDFALSHTLGFDSVADMARISAAVCDNCLLTLVVNHIPGAVVYKQQAYCC